MPRDSIGQLITFAMQIDRNLSNKPVVIHARQGDTVRKIAKRYNHPELVTQILALNTDVRIKNGHFLRSATQVLKTGTIIRIPGVAKPGESFTVHADDPRPIIKAGYAKYDTVNRPGRVGLNRFLYYDPIEMAIAIQFEGYEFGGPEVLLGSGVSTAGSALLQFGSQLTGAPPDPGTTIESHIALLERMAGRGDFNGAANGPPAVIRVSCTDNNGNPVWLIPSNYQWSQQNQTAPLWRISDIAWAGGDLSDLSGQRVRSKAIVTVKQYTPLTQITRSVSQRAKAKGK